MTYQLIGIGAGAFNLSLAAMLDDIGHDSHVFLDEKESFSWYPGLDTDVSELQDDYLGDLVTLTNPRSRFSFLAYMHERGLIYQFIGRKASPLSRRIYAEYFRWASEKLQSIRYSSPVREINFRDNLFEISAGNRVMHARNIVLGVGISPALPDFVQPFLGQNVYHSGVYSERSNDLDGKTVAVIGGGQSSAEVLLDILCRCSPAKVIWISPKGYHAHMDEGAINYDIWSPTFMQEFFKLDPAVKQGYNHAILNTSDGITNSTLNDLYVKLFDKKYFDKASLESVVMTNTRLTGMREQGSRKFIAVVQNLTGKHYEFPVDEVVLATGYSKTVDTLLGSLYGAFPELADEDRLNADFSLKWRHAATNRIYVHNAAVDQYSVLEKSLLLASWRSAMIINSLYGKEVFKSKPDSTMHTYHADLERYEVGH
jgi:lysine N6-hydroxylase